LEDSRAGAIDIILSIRAIDLFFTMRLFDSNLGFLNVRVVLPTMDEYTDAGFDLPYSYLMSSRSQRTKHGGQPGGSISNM
jgi:hypothetical protein